MADNSEQFCFQNLSLQQQNWFILQALQNLTTNNMRVVNAPSNSTDFSTLPGGVAPGIGSYIAFDDLNIYTIQGGETHWFTTPR